MRLGDAEVFADPGPGEFVDEPHLDDAPFAVVEFGDQGCQGVEVLDEFEGAVVEADEVAIQAATATPAGNCFTGNAESTTNPGRMPGTESCGTGAASAAPTTPPLGHASPVAAPPDISFQDVPPPPPQPPHARTAPPIPGTDLPGKADPGRFALPPGYGSRNSLGAAPARLQRQMSRHCGRTPLPKDAAQ